MPKTVKKYRKYPLYKDYIKNVVEKCGHDSVVLDHKDFRAYRFESLSNPKAKLPAGVLLKVVPARCKSYSCPICGKHKVLTLLERLQQIDLSKYRFFTLTLRSEGILTDTEKNIKRISNCFNNLNKKLRKKPEYKKLEYFRVIEVGKGGMVHIHGIWNKYIPVKLLSKLWLTVTKDSYRVDVRRIKSTNDVFNYIYKYLTKNQNVKESKTENLNLEQFESFTFENTEQLFYENGKRRWCSSRGFFSGVKKIKSVWLTYYYEKGVQDREVEIAIESNVRQYGLKMENVDITHYFGSLESQVKITKILEGRTDDG